MPFLIEMDVFDWLLGEYLSEKDKNMALHSLQLVRFTLQYVEKRG